MNRECNNEEKEEANQNEQWLQWWRDEQGGEKRKTYQKRENENEAGKIWEEWGSWTSRGDEGGHVAITEK